MIQIPTMIPAAVRSRTQRREARRTYAELSDLLNETIDALYTLTDHDVRAARMGQAADLIEQMSMLHTVAWGPEIDAQGRTAAHALGCEASLLRRVAASERAVVLSNVVTVTVDDPTALTYADAAELLAWAQLSQTAAPDLRAVYLRRLHAPNVARFGDRAAAVLLVLAEIEDRRAAGLSLPRPRRFLLPRVVVGAVFFALALAVAGPALAEDADRAVPMVAVTAAALVTLSLIDRIVSAIRSRRSRIHQDSAHHDPAHQDRDARQGRDGALGAVGEAGR